MGAVFATRSQRRALAADNRRQSDALTLVPKSEWPIELLVFEGRKPVAIWRSREFLVQIFSHEIATRITVCRTEVTGNSWRDGISWEQLQNIKLQCGFGDQCAIEIFPPERDVVNVANMRHLWIVPPPPFMWRAPSVEP